MRQFFAVFFAFSFAVSTIGLTGCGGSGGKAEKLEADSDIDWDAIEKAGDEMNAEMTQPENEN